MRKHYLNNVFEPRSVAVVGASERESSVGGQVLRNIIDGGFKGPIFPVNPKYETVLGLPPLNEYLARELIQHTRAA